MTLGQDYVHIALPRTASLSVTRWLVDNYKGTPAPGNYHRADIPIDATGKTVFTVIRHPYERMVSLWKCLAFTFWKTPNVAIGENGPKDKMNLEEFVRWCERADIAPNYRTQFAILSECKAKRVLLIKYDKLEDGLNRLPFVTVPFNGKYQLNKTEGVYFLSDRERALICRQSAEDFDAFGFKS